MKLHYAIIFLLSLLCCSCSSEKPNAIEVTVELPSRLADIAGAAEITIGPMWGTGFQTEVVNFDGGNVATKTYSVVDEDGTIRTLVITIVSLPAEVTILYNLDNNMIINVNIAANSDFEIAETNKSKILRRLTLRRHSSH
jgi:hypothetical protein